MQPAYSPFLMLPVAAAMNRLVEMCLMQNSTSMNSIWRQISMKTMKTRSILMKIQNCCSRISIFLSIFSLECQFVVFSGHSAARPMPFGSSPPFSHGVAAFPPALGVRSATTSQGPGSRPKCGGPDTSVCSTYSEKERQEG